MAINVIWKYMIGPGPINLELPKGAKFLSMLKQPHEQNLSVWFQVDPEAEKEVRQFVTLPTGRPFHADCGSKAEYLATGMVANDTLVFHLYEIFFNDKNAEFHTGELAIEAAKKAVKDAVQESIKEQQRPGNILGKS